MTKDIKRFITKNFNVSLDKFVEAIKISQSAQGYILGAISEVLLKDYLVKEGFEIRRIKEKPKGGEHGKSSEARGDFYIRKPGEQKWLVIESKGLKSNAEFSYSRRKQLNNKKGLKKFLFAHAIKGHFKDKLSYKKAKKLYGKSRALWLDKNKDKQFPIFRWQKDWPGPCNCHLTKIWKTEKMLNDWINALNENNFSEQNYRKKKGPIIILETHAPSNRVAPKTNIKHAAPLVQDFSIMAVDLFIKTGKHDFVFMNPERMNHSPTSPEHLYQNYIVDILIPGIKDDLSITPPWYSTIGEVFRTNPNRRNLDASQLDNRGDKNTLDFDTDV